MSVASERDLRLPDGALRWIFQRGGSKLQRQLMDKVWADLKRRHPDADCRQQDRFIGLYLTPNTSDTFARINSKSSGPVVGIESVVVDAYAPSLLRPLDFPKWGFVDPRGFLLQESTLWELLELLDLAYRYRKNGAHVLGNFRRYKQEQEKQVRADIESVITEEPREEGKRIVRTSSIAERDEKLVAAAIRIHGLKCAACGFDFEAVYGDRGKNFIEVHHNDPLSTRFEVRLTDPRTDLEVVCSNCHRMIHRQRSNVLTVAELRQIIKIAKRSRRNAPK